MPNDLATWEGVRRIALALPEAESPLPHFDGHTSILVRLNRISLPELDEVIVEAWLSRAPKPLAQRYIDTQL